MARHVIKPKRGLLDIDLRAVWHYRDLVYMYIKRDIITKYKQTILGPVWYVVQPVLTTVIYMFVFGRYLYRWCASAAILYGRYLAMELFLGVF